MADTRLLLARLEEYSNVLDVHLQQLEAEYRDVTNTWRGFSAVYEGDAADQFRGGWVRTCEGFEAYIRQTRMIRAMLDERIIALRDANRTESGLF